MVCAAELPGPVSLEEGRVVDDGWQQSRESPEKQSGKELSDDGILDKETSTQQSQDDSGNKTQQLPGLLKICSGCGFLHWDTRQAWWH